VPTHDETAAFLRVRGKMDGNARAAFLNAMSLLVEWLRQPDNPPPRTLRLHPVGHHPVYGTVWSMTWAPDGRGLFVYGLNCGQVIHMSSGRLSAATTFTADWAPAGLMWRCESLVPGRQCGVTGLS
jgi:hypothetical protein